MSDCHPRGPNFDPRLYNRNFPGSIGSGSRSTQPREENWLFITTNTCMLLVGQVAQAARRLAAGWTARVRSRVSEGCRFFFTPSCPDWPWGPLDLL